MPSPIMTTLSLDAERSTGEGGGSRVRVTGAVDMGKGGSACRLHAPLRALVAAAAPSTSSLRAKAAPLVSVDAGAGRYGTGCFVEQGASSNV